MSIPWDARVVTQLFTVPFLISLLPLGLSKAIYLAYPLVGSESLCQAQLDIVLNGKNVFLSLVSLRVETYISMGIYLHSRIVHAKGEVSIADL